MRHPPLPLTRDFSDHKWLWLWSYHCIPWLSIRVMDPRFPGPKMLGLGYYPEISRTQNVGLGLWIRDLPDPKWLGLWYYPEISRTQNVGLGLGIRDFPDPKS